MDIDHEVGKPTVESPQEKLQTDGIGFVVRRFPLPWRPAPSTHLLCVVLSLGRLHLTAGFPLRLTQLVPTLLPRRTMRTR